VGAADEPVRLMRFANRVPLLHQQAACAVTKGLIQTNWKSYGLTQPRGGLQRRGQMGETGAGKAGQMHAGTPLEGPA